MTLVGGVYLIAIDAPMGTQPNAVDQPQPVVLSIPVIADVSQDWNVTWGGTLDDSAGHCALDNTSEYVYFAGYTYSFSVGSADGLLVKYAINGTQIWNRTWGGSLVDEFSGILIDKMNNVYVTGYTVSFSVGGAEDALLVKYDSEGNQIWNRTWGKAYRDCFNNIAMDTNGYIYLATQHLITSSNVDMALVKYNSNGNQIWNRTWGTSGTDDVGSVAVDLNTNDVYLSGSSSNFDANLLKYDSAGNMLWERVWGGTAQDLQAMCAVDSVGCVYIAGRTYSFGIENAFIAKYNSEGTELWSQTWGGTAEEGAGWLGINADDEAYIAGHTSSYGTGGFDGFVVKYSSTGTMLGEITWGGVNDEILGGACIDVNGNLYLSMNTNSWGRGGKDACLAYVSEPTFTDAPTEDLSLWMVIPAIIAVVIVSLYLWQRKKGPGLSGRERYQKPKTTAPPPRITPQPLNVEVRASPSTVYAARPTQAARVAAPVNGGIKVTVQRQFEYVGGKVRVKAKVTNATPQGILRVRIALDVPNSFHLLRIEPSEYDHEGTTVKLNDLLPKEEKAVAWVLEPLICGKESIGGTTSGVDANGIPFAVPLNPLEVQVRCPLFARPEEVNLPTVQRMIGDLAVKSERVFYLPLNLAPADALEVAKAAISCRDVSFVGTFASNQVEGAFDQSAWFYGTTKVGQKRYILTASVSEKDRAIRIFTACDDEAGCTGFLAEAGAAIRRELVQRGAVDSEEKVKELVCEKCGGNLPHAPTIGQDVQCPECRWTWRVSDFFR